MRKTGVWAELLNEWTKFQKHYNDSSDQDVTEKDIPQ